MKPQHELSIGVGQLLKYPNVHPSLAHLNDGLFCTSDIPSNTLLISCPSSSIISKHTLPCFIQEIPKLDDSDKIVLYLVLLKNADNSHLSAQLRKWLSRKTMGFVSVDEKLIKQSRDEQMMIEYYAYRSHYRQQATNMYRCQPIQALLKKYTAISNSQQFTQQWIEASQFKNTRSFGHTGEYLLIPGMDYLNYDPARACHKIVFVTYDDEEEIHGILICQQMGRMGVKIPLVQDQLAECNDEDSDFEEQMPEETKKYVGIISTSPISVGEQLYFDYGRLSNYKMLKHYGYAVRNNPYDYVSVYLSNYAKPNPMSFSAIERCTTKFKLYANRINQKLITHWTNVNRCQKNSSRNHHISCFVNEMKKVEPPRMRKDQLEELSRRSGFEYLNLFQQEQARIYEANVTLMIDYLNEENRQEGQMENEIEDTEMGNTY